MNHPPPPCAKPAKRRLPLLPVLAALCLFAPLAVAEDACRLSLSSPTVDYGQLSRAELLDNQPGAALLPLGKRNLTLHVNCSAPTLMALRFRGAKADAQSYRFGPNGRFSLRLLRAQLDGKPVLLGQSSGLPQQADNFTATAFMLPEHWLVAGMAGANLTGSQLSVQLEVAPQVEATATRVSQSQTWQAEGSFELLSPQPTIRQTPRSE